MITPNVRMAGIVIAILPLVILYPFMQTLLRQGHHARLGQGIAQTWPVPSNRTTSDAGPVLGLREPALGMIIRDGAGILTKHY